VLIIDRTTTGNVVLQNNVAAKLNWQGLVIIRSPGQVHFELENANARIRVFGQVVNRAATRAEIELNKQNNFIKYSSAARNMIEQAFASPFAVRSWREVAL
jgi:hypothetical protein